MSDDGSEPIGSTAELTDFLRGGEKPPARWRVGTEHEKIGLSESDHAPIPYDGDRGIRAVLERVAERDDWEPGLEAGNVIELRKDGASITLEPGGQLELSGAPLRTIHETCDEFQTHLALMKEVCAPLGIVWLGLGMHPLHPVSALPVMPKARYEIMRAYLPQRGSLALEMMFATATVQANFDYASENDMIAKLRTALAVQPLISAIFANSSLAEGKPNGFISRRLHTWEHTDPDRCGMLDFAFQPDFGYERYVDWALDVPMFFVVREGRYLPAEGRTFRQFLERGLGHYRATLGDFDRHLTTLFPDVRLKRFIEVRGADAVPPGLTCSLPALWKGLFYDAGALDAAFEMVRGWTPAAVEAGLADVTRRGLSAELAGRSVAEWMAEVTDLAAVGLARIDDRNPSGEDERRFLEPVREQLELGKSPGEAVIERWEGDWRRSPERLIEYARY